MSKNDQISKVSINKLKKLVNYQISEPVLISFPISETETIEVSVKKYLSKEDKVNFVNDVVSGVFNQESFQPYFKEELFNIAILEYFTDIKVDTKIEFLLKLVTQTTLCENIKYSIDKELLSCLITTVDDMIEYRKLEILSSEKQKLQSAVDEITQLTESFVKIENQFKDIDTNNMLDIFKKIADKDDYSLAKATLEVVSDNDASKADQHLEGQITFKQ